MVNLDNVNALRTGLTTFFIVFLIGVAVYKFLPANYKIAASDISKSELFTEQLSPYDFYQILNSEDIDIQIVDIRNEEQFNESSFKNSINIPAEQVLNRANIKKLRKNKNLIISDLEGKSHSIALLLLQLGINAVPVNSDYQFIRENIIEYFNHTQLFFSCEKKAYDYQRFIPVEEAIEIEEVKIDLDALGGC